MGKIQSFIISGLTLMLSSYITYNILKKSSKPLISNNTYISKRIILKKHIHKKRSSNLKEKLNTYFKDISKDCIDSSTLYPLTGVYYSDMDNAYACNDGKKFNNDEYPSNSFNYFNNISTCDENFTSYVYYKDNDNVGSLVDSNNSIIISDSPDIDLNSIESKSDFICHKDLNGANTSFIKFQTEFNTVNYMNTNSGEILYPYTDGSIIDFHYKSIDNINLFYANIFYADGTYNLYDIINENLIFDRSVDTINENLIPIIDFETNEKKDLLIEAYTNYNLLLKTYLDSKLITDKGSNFNNLGFLNIECGGGEDYHQIITFNESQVDGSSEIDSDNNLIPKEYLIAYDLSTKERIMETTGSKILAYNCDSKNNSLVFLIDNRSKFNLDLSYYGFKVVSTSEYLYTKYFNRTELDTNSYFDFAYNSNNYLTYYNLKDQSFEDN